MSPEELEALLICGTLGSGTRMPAGLQSLGRGVSVTASVLDSKHTVKPGTLSLLGSRSLFGLKASRSSLLLHWEL